MNKIYRTVYNESTNTWVAVEETAKSHRKSSGGVVDNATADVSGCLKSLDFKKSAIIVAMVSLFTPLSVWAADPQGIRHSAAADSASNKNYEAQIENNKGAYNTVLDLNQTVWGKNNSVTGEHASVLGGQYNIAGNVQESGKSVTKVEYNKNTGIYTLTLSDGTKVTRTLAQLQSIISSQNATSSGQGQVVLGGESNVASGNNAVAWGLGNTASGANSTAFGSGSTASGSNATAWGSGYAGAAQSTDTVNYTISSGNYPADENGNKPTYTYTRPVSGFGENATAWGGGRAIGLNATAMANGKAYGNSSLAVGNGAIAYGPNSVAFNQGKALGSASIAFGRATAEGPNSFANGSSGTIAKGSNAVAFGESTYADGNNAMVWGFGTKTTGYNATAFGKYTVASGQRATAFGSETQALADNSVTAGGEKNVIQSGANNAAALGGQNAQITGINSVTLGGNGSQALASNSLAALGGVVNAGASNAVALGGNATLKDSVALGSGSTTAAGVPVESAGKIGDATYTNHTWSNTLADTNKVVSVGNRQIQDIANGQVSETSTDAINGSQLYAAYQDLQWKASVSRSSDGGTVSGSGEVAKQVIGDYTGSLNKGVVNFKAGKGIEIETANNGSLDMTFKVDKAEDHTATNGKIVAGSPVDKYWDNVQVTNAINDSGWKLTNSGELINPGDSVTFTGENGINVTADGSNVKIKFDKQIPNYAAGNNVSFTDTTDNAGNPVTKINARDTIVQEASANQHLSVNGGNLDETTGVRNYTIQSNLKGDDKNITVANDGKISFTDTHSWIASDGTNRTTVNKDKEVVWQGSGSLKVENENGTFTISDKTTYTSEVNGLGLAKTGDEVKLTGVLPTSKVQAGSNIVSVDTSSDATTGVTTYTVNATGVAHDSANKYIKVTGGDKENFVVNEEGLDDAIKAAKSEVVAGKGGVSVDPVRQNTDGANVYTVNAIDTQITSGNGHITIAAAEPDDNGVRNYVVKSNLKGDGENISVADDGTISFTDTHSWIASDGTNRTTVNKDKEVVWQGSGSLKVENENGTFTISDKTTYTSEVNGLGLAKTGDEVKLTGVLPTSKVQAGSNIVSVDTSSDATTGVTTYTVNATGVAHDSANKYIKVTGGDKENFVVNEEGLDDAIKAAKSEVVAGKGGVSVDPVRQNTDGANVYTVNAIDTKINPTGKYTSVAGGEVDENGVRTYTINSTLQSGKDIEIGADGKINYTGTDNDTKTTVTTADSNLKVTPKINGENREYDIALNKNLDLSDLGSLKVGDTLVNNAGVSAKTITGDTVNANTLNAGTGNVFNVSGSTATYNTTVSGSNGKEVANVDYVNKVQTVVEQGKNTVVTGIKNDKGGMTYTVDAYDTKVKAGNGLKLTQNGDTADSNNVRTYELALDDTNQAAINNAMSGLTTAVDGATAQTLDKTNNQANFVTGDNIQLSGDANGITIATKKDVTFNNVMTGSLKADTANISTGNISTLNAGNNFSVAGDTATYNTTVSGNDGKEVANVAYVQKALPTVKAGTNIVSVAETSEDGHKVYTVNAKGVQAASGNQYITVDDNGTNFVINEGLLASDIKAAKSEVVAGKGGVSIDPVSQNTDGANVYTVNAIDTQITSGNGHISIAAAEPDDNGVRNYVVKSNLKGDGENISVADDGTISFTDTHSWIASDGKNRTSVNKDKEVVWQGSGSLKVENENGTFTISDNTTYTSKVTGLTLDKKGDTVELGGDLTQFVNDTVKPLKFKGDSGDTIEPKHGDTVEIVGDNNISVVGKDGKLNVQLNPNVDLGDSGSLKTGDTTMNNNGVTVGGVSLTKDGLNNGGNKITHVAAGEAPTDAVNVSQLDKGLKAARTQVVAGENIRSVDKTAGTNGEDIYTVNAVGVKAAPGNKYIQVTGGGKDDFVIDDSLIDTAIGDASFSLTSSNQGTSTGITADIKKGSTVTINGGDNIAVSQTGSTITVATAKDVKFDSVETGTLKAGDTKLGDNFEVKGGKVTYNQTPSDDNEVVNKKYADNLGWDLQVNGTKQGNTITNGKAVNFANGDNTTVKFEDNAVKVNVNTTTLTATDGKVNNPATGGNNLTTAQNVADMINQTYWIAQDGNGKQTQVKAGDAVTWQGQGSLKVENSNGTFTISDNTTYASTVTGLTLDKKGDTVELGGNLTQFVNDTVKPLKFKGDSGDTIEPKHGDTVEIVGDNNISVVGKDGKLNVQLNPNVDLGDSGSLKTGDTTINNNGVTVGGVSLTKDGLNNGGNKITHVAAGEAPDEAVNVSQLDKGLKAARTQVVAGENIRSVDKTAGTNGEDIYTVNAVGVVEQAGGNKYVKVSGGGTDDFVIDDSALDTAITNISLKASPVQYSNADDPITANGGTPSNDVTLIGADNTQPVVIHNVGAGYRPTDAVNVSQLQQVAGNLNNRMDGISQHSDASAASAIAVASMPQAYLPGKNLVSIGGGTYHGQTGYAVGISTISDNGSWIFKATATGNSKNRYGGGIGAGFQW